MTRRKLRGKFGLKVIVTHQTGVEELDYITDDGELFHSTYDLEPAVSLGFINVRYATEEDLKTKVWFGDDSK